MTLHPEESRRLRATWSQEAADDFAQMHPSLTPEEIAEREEEARLTRERFEQQLTQTFAEEIGREIDEELIADLRIAGQRVVAQQVADDINRRMPSSLITFASNYQYTTSSKDDEYISWKEFGF